MTVQGDFDKIIDTERREPERTFSLPVKWDAEHPHLYELTASLKEGGATTEQIVQEIGFRKVEVRGNKILINDKRCNISTV